MAVALVTIHQVNAAPIVQARAAIAFVNLVTTDGSHVPRVADASVGVNPILALAMVARVWVAVVDVLITQHASKTSGTLAFIAIRVIDALGPIQAGSTGAVVNVDLAHWACEPRGTQALEAIDFVHTLPIVHTWVALAFVHLQLTMHTFESWHAQTGEASDLIQAGGIVLAGV